MIQVNPLLGEAVAPIGEEQLLLVVDVAALLLIEQLTGRAFLEVAAELLVAAERKRPPKLATMQALAFAATRAKHPELTAPDCATLYLTHAKALGEAISAALVAALPKGTGSGEA